MRKLLLTAVLLLSAVAMQAQELHFGAKLGGALTNFSISGGEEGSLEPQSKFGFYIGAMAEYKFNDQFAVAPELIITSAGATFEESETEESMGYISTASLTVDDKLMYIYMPVLMKYYVNENLSFHFGPQIGFLMSAKYDFESESKMVDSNGAVVYESSDSGNDVDVKDDVNSTDLGIVFGVGYKLENGLFFDARYNLGLSNIAKDESSTDAKNTAIQIGVGFFFK